MRDIGFRGKRIDNGEWVYGYYYHSTINGLDYIADFKDTRAEQVDPETVGQYTGLTDKNGKKVYEGDICRDKLGETRKVVFIESWGAFATRLIWGLDADGNPVKVFGGSRNFWNDSTDYEVIGNIHDNPEQ